MTAADGDGDGDGDPAGPPTGAEPPTRPLGARGPGEAALATLHRFAPLFGLVGALLLMALLRAEPPGPGSIYPRCTFHRWSGLYCPGCGTARCLAALARGDLLQALAWNALTAMLAPIGAVLLVAGSVRAVRGPRAPRDEQAAPAPRRLLPRGAGPAIALAVIGFGVLRNLPIWPFALLAPRALGG